MKTHLNSLTILSVLSLAAAANAGVTLSNNSLGSSTSFPSYMINASDVPLSFQAVGTTPSGVTLQGGASQGPVSVGTGFGETFYWTGGAATLNAVSIIDNGGGGAATFQPFLFDLGTSLYNSTTTGFIPNNYVNLLSAVTVQPNAFGSANFLEFDFSGADAVALTSGHSYAFGLVNNNGTSDMNYRRSGGGASDSNGIGFTFSSLTQTTSINPSPYSTAVRNVFLGIYATAVPEPSSLAMLGLGLVALIARSRKS